MPAEERKPPAYHAGGPSPPLGDRCSVLLTTHKVGSDHERHRHGWSFGSPHPVSTAASQQLRSDWDQFTHAAPSGQATLTLTETGVTSRGVEYIDEKDIPLKNLQVHFCSDGLGEALGTIDTPGPNINVLLRGTLDLSGSKPRIDVRTIKAGNFPGFGTSWILNNIIKKGNADVLNIDAPLTGLKITDGSAALTAGH